MDILEKMSDKLTTLIGTPASIAVHTLFFIGIFILSFFGVSIDQILLILTTVVSLEAIYLAIFIQMTVNRTSTTIVGVKDDISEIQDDVEDIQEDVDDLEENVDDIQEDVEGLETNIKEISVDYADSDKEEDDLVRALASIEKRLNELHKEIATLKSKK